jgi:prepilin-type N-terminal cleavage/methylation domain-containing protein
VTIRHANDARGFSAVELLIAIAMLGILMLGFMSVFPMGIRTVVKGERLTVATSLAQDELERLKTLPDTDADLLQGNHVDPANPILGVYTRTWVVTDNAPMADMKTIAMTISYTENGIPRNVNVTTYLAP